jgi:hypothetical protein
METQDQRSFLSTDRGTAFFGVAMGFLSLSLVFALTFYLVRKYKLHAYALISSSLADTEQNTHFSSSNSHHRPTLTGDDGKKWFNIV